MCPKRADTRELGGDLPMTRKSPKPKKTSDPEQYKRFREMEETIGASKDPKAFDKAFKKVTNRPPDR